MLTNEQYKSMTALFGLEFQQKMERYSYFDADLSKWVMHLDNMRFINHSDERNTRCDATKMYATRDIQAGEELYDDYTAYAKTGSLCASFLFERVGYEAP